MILGVSLLILIGGEQEMIKAKPYQNVLCLRNRKGFVRLALESLVYCSMNKSIFLTWLIVVPI